MGLKRFLKYFVFLFLIVFLVINWNNISWVFNYKAISRVISDFFQKENSATTLEYSTREGSLEIPKIEISAPLVFVKNSNGEDVYKSLDRGVVHFPSSVLPGEAGQTIILGHSAPPGWPKIKYDWVFSRINELAEGDEIFVYFDNKEFKYSVTKKIFLERGEEIPKDSLTNSKNVLILISCWPPGKDIRRIAVEAKLIKS